MSFIGRFTNNDPRGEKSRNFQTILDEMKQSGLEFQRPHADPTTKQRIRKPVRAFLGLNLHHNHDDKALLGFRRDSEADKLFNGKVDRAHITGTNQFGQQQRHTLTHAEFEAQQRAVQVHYDPRWIPNQRIAAQIVKMKNKEYFKNDLKTPVDFPDAQKYPGSEKLRDQSYMEWLETLTPHISYKIQIKTFYDRNGYVLNNPTEKVIDYTHAIRFQRAFPGKPVSSDLKYFTDYYDLSKWERDGARPNCRLNERKIPELELRIKAYLELELFTGNERKGIVAINMPNAFLDGLHIGDKKRVQKIYADQLGKLLQDSHLKASLPDLQGVMFFNVPKDVSIELSKSLENASLHFPFATCSGYDLSAPKLSMQECVKRGELKNTVPVSFTGMGDAGIFGNRAASDSAEKGTEEMFTRESGGYAVGIGNPVINRRMLKNIKPCPGMEKLEKKSTKKIQRKPLTRPTKSPPPPPQERDEWISLLHDQSPNMSKEASKILQIAKFIESAHSNQGQSSVLPKTRVSQPAQNVDSAFSRLANLIVDRHRLTTEKPRIFVSDRSKNPDRPDRYFSFKSASEAKQFALKLSKHPFSITRRDGSNKSVQSDAHGYHCVYLSDRQYQQLSLALSKMPDNLQQTTMETSQRISKRVRLRNVASRTKNKIKSYFWSRPQQDVSQEQGELATSIKECFSLEKEPQIPATTSSNWQISFDNQKDAENFVRSIFGKGITNRKDKTKQKTVQPIGEQFKVFFADHQHQKLLKIVADFKSSHHQSHHFSPSPGNGK